MSENDGGGHMDCGDNSCEFAPKRGGMRTNGGCSCLDGLSVEQRRKVRAVIHGLRVRADAEKLGAGMLEDEISDALHRIGVGDAPRLVDRIAGLGEELTRLRKAAQERDGLRAEVGRLANQSSAYAQRGNRLAVTASVVRSDLADVNDRLGRFILTRTKERDDARAERDSLRQQLEAAQRTEMHRGERTLSQAPRCHQDPSHSGAWCAVHDTGPDWHSEVLGYRGPAGFVCPDGGMTFDDKLGEVAMVAYNKAADAAQEPHGDTAHADLAAAQQRIGELETRQQELLATIVRVTNETPFTDEIKGWEGQRAKLMAEIGTLRARIAQLETRLYDAEMHGAASDTRVRSLTAALRAIAPVYRAALEWAGFEGGEIGTMRLTQRLRSVTLTARAALTPEQLELIERAARGVPLT